LKNGPHELLSPLPADSARTGRTIGKAAFPQARFMSEKSGFAKAEVIENE
jgi:hypothetical protein